ncbi:MAG: T9SS type A sorting domain-containing protein [Calditrichaeota bacterium]|nr:T9SS type A sorting domain-containing protein [Calditrichota bacterium]
MKRLLFVPLILFLTFTTGRPNEQKKMPRYYKSSLSQRFVKNIFSGENGQTPQLKAELPDTLKILALRVQFQPDNDRTTTGNGLFDLSQPDSIVINSPPHNRNYFINQLKALKNYYENVSRGKLTLQISDGAENYFVFPQQQDSAYSLPQPMAYYNPNAGEEPLDQGLAELFRDAIQTADENSDIDFSQFDVYIIFHAGVGSEFSQDFDTTPSDIPSVFLNVNDLKKTIGKDEPNFEGIRVNNDQNIVSEGIILPETESQSGVEIAMLGSAVIMMGHQLGLPNLFDTDSGRPGIGRFGIMDQGSGSFSGFIPVQPCAWSKIFLGWEEPITIFSGENIPVAAPLAANFNKIYKIPINAKEYFLIENRQRNVLKSRAIAIGHDEFGNRIEFNDNGDIILPASIQKLGVVVDLDEYDFGLPGSGIVIWHIDEQVIEQNFASNRVNADMHHRGVDVVEADGAQDIGYFYNFFGITGFSAGSAYDFWWSKNEDHIWANDSDSVRFTPTSMPNSNAYSGASSGIYLTNFSDLDSVMTFSLEIKKFRPGFPVFLGKNSGMSPIVAADLDHDGSQEMIAATENGKILAWHSDGSSFFENDEKTKIVKLNGDTVLVPLPVFASVPDEHFPYPPSVADMDQDGIPEVIAASLEGELFVWHPRDADGDGYADEPFRATVMSPIMTAPLIRSGSVAQIALGLSDGNVFVLDFKENYFFYAKLTDESIIGLADLTPFGSSDWIVVSSSGDVLRMDEKGDQVWKSSLSADGEFQGPAVADINSDGSPEIVISTTGGKIFVLRSDGSVLSDFDKIETNCPLSPPTIADVDYNGYPDVVLAGGGKIFAFQYNGVSVTNFPMTFEPGNVNGYYPSPVIADIDNDHFPEIFISKKSGVITAFSIAGEKRSDFPLSVSDTVAAVISLNSLDGNKFNLIARSGDGYGYVWNLNYDFDSDLLFWGDFLKDNSHNPVFAKSLTPAPSSGTKLMPVRKVYNYPNPADGKETTIRYYLEDDATMSVRIYDAAGELVKEISATGIGGLSNELIWDLTNVQSGVYLARVHAENSKKSETVIIKIAVMK